MKLAKSCNQKRNWFVSRAKITWNYYSWFYNISWKSSIHLYDKKLISRDFCPKVLFELTENNLYIHAQCGSLRNFPPSIFYKMFAKISWNWSVVMKYRVKVVLANHNFWQFRVNLRENVLNKCCRGGFLLLETIETSGASGGVSRFYEVWNLPFWTSNYYPFANDNWKNTNNIHQFDISASIFT